MTPAEIQHELYEEIGRLAPEQQQRLLELAHELKRKSALPKGTPWSEIKHLAGTLPDEDAAEIIAAIEEGCEDINYDAW
ncbi:MAG TPA: hypothetical protein VFH95_01850 [Candidatus Kapabacteria bacterium]|nr:hypothetical protein [Candidatus Kapabacteria bacterium]